MGHVQPKTANAGLPAFDRAANALFAKVDTNHDGTLGAKELDTAATATTFSKAETATIRTLRGHFAAVAKLSNDEHFTESKGITRDDLDALRQLGPGTPLITSIAASLAGGGQAPATSTKAVTKQATSTGPAKAATPPPAAANTTAKAPLLKRINLTHVKEGVTKLWEKKNPWVHERTNTRQVDPQAEGIATPFTTDARAVFAKVDADRNGTLSTAELTKAMRSPDYKQGQAAAVGAMHRYVDDIEDLSNDERFLETKGITQQDLNQFDKLKIDSDLGGKVRGNYSWGKVTIQRANRELFPKGTASITGTAVEQGSLGDCYFLAGVSGLAAIKPEAIKQMITANQDGTYTVTFPGRKAVTVTAPTDAEIGQYVISGQNGLWLNVLEKAYAQSRNDSRLFAKGDMYKAIEGGYGKQSIRALTGNAADMSRISLLSHSQLLAKVSQAQADGRLMTIATGHPFGRSTTKANGLPTGHEYTMMGYDATTRKYQIRNPWATGGTKGDGVLQLTAEEVKQNFATLTVEKAKK
jgi:hypothetical protein